MENVTKLPLADKRIVGQNKECELWYHNTQRGQNTHETA